MAPATDSTVRGMFDRSESGVRPDAAAERFARLAERLPLVPYVGRPAAGGSPAYVGPQAAALLGYAPDDFYREPGLWHERLHPEDRVRVTSLLQEAYERREPQLDVEYRFLARDGRVLWLRDVAALARDGGAPQEYRGFVLDETDRKEREARMLRAQRLDAAGRLAGGIAHDLNNLLAVVAGHASLLRAAIAGDGDLERDAEAIVDASARAEQLTRRLLAIGRAQVLRPRPRSLNAAVGRLERILDHPLPDGVELRVELTVADPWTFVDADQLDQVLRDLVANACDAVSAGGTLHIRTAVVPVQEGHPVLTPGEYAAIEVTDDGLGREASAIERALESPVAPAGDQVGSALVLATVLGIVAQSQGHVEVESAPAAGTTVRVLLPACDPDQTPAGDEEGEARPPARGRDALILLVEDEPVVRRLTTLMLERSGYRVLAVGEGDAALEAVTVSPEVDLVVTDVVMPGMSGRLLAERLRELKPDLPVLFVSGYPADLVGSDNRLPPASGYLAKPFTHEALDEAVAALLGV